MATLRLDVRELEELKRVIERVEHPTDTLREIREQVQVALFQESIQEGDWFRWIETDAVFEAFEVDREEGRVWFFDPLDQRDSWVRITQVAPATPEEIEEAKRTQEELNRLYDERCKKIEAYLAKEYPGGTFIPVEHLPEEWLPKWIEVDGVVLGRYAWSGWPNSYHYTVNMTE